MAPVITRIIIFLFSLLIIVLLLAGAAKGEDNIRFQLLSSKEMIKKELPLDQGSSKIIITESQEYPKRTYSFDPLVLFNDEDDVMLCGYKLSTVDFTGTKIDVRLYSALFPNELSIENLIRLETVQLSPFDNDLAYDEMNKLELYPYTMKIIKNNTLLDTLERNKKEGSVIIGDSSNNFMWNKGEILKEFYMGEYDLHVEFVRGYPVHIPVPINTQYLGRKIEMIELCLLELKKNETRINLSQREIYKDVMYQIY